MFVSDETKERWYTVIIEWDGEAPPQKWYRRIHNLAGEIRPEGNGSVITRRAGEQALVTGTNGEMLVDADNMRAQEGVFLFKSRSLANIVATYAQAEAGKIIAERGGTPPTIFVGESIITTVFAPDPNDFQIVNRIEKRLSKRGRRPEKTDYVVTCHECVESYQVEKPKGYAISCPSCGGVKVHSREGALRTVADHGGDIVDFWKRTRFSTPHFEVCNIADDGTPPVTAVVMDGKAETIVDMVQGSPDFIAAVTAVAARDRLEAMKMLDAAFVGRMQHREADRLMPRMEAIQKFVLRGGAITRLMIAESPVIDLLDCALLLGSDRVCDYLVEFVK